MNCDCASEMYVSSLGVQERSLNLEVNPDMCGEVMGWAVCGESAAAMC